jgi:hypothetical protein
MEKYIGWWEPMPGRICVAKKRGAKERWIIGVYAPAQEGRERVRFWEWLRVIRAFVEEEGIAAVWGGDWNAVSDPREDRSSGGEWASGGDKGMKKAMVGKIRECTKGSGPTWKGTRSGQQGDGEGKEAGKKEEVEGGEKGRERWARLDSWWAMEGMRVEMVERVNHIPVEFSQHRGVAVKWTSDSVTIPETTYRQLKKLPPKEDPIWEKFRSRLEHLVQRALEEGGGAGEVAAAWDLAAKEIFPTGAERHRKFQGRVPSLLPMTAWGPGKCGSRRMWGALRALRGGEEVGPPRLEKDGRELTPAETLEEAEKRWTRLYAHPRGGEEWCGEDEWKARLEEVKKVVARGKRIWTEVEPPDWETFRAYVRQLPEGKGGAGMLRYEMYKHAGEEELKVWYENVVVPVVRGDWQPDKWLKEADLALVYKRETVHH